MRAALLATCVSILAACSGLQSPTESRTPLSNGVTYVLPTGWAVYETDVLRTQVKTVLDSGATGEVATTYSRLLELIDQKVLVGGALAAPTGSRAAILVFEIPTASTLDETADAALALVPPLASEIITSRTTEDVPIGKAVVVMTSSQPVGGTPTDTVRYVIDLGNGRALYLDGAEPTGDNSLPPIMAKLVSSLAKP